MKQLRSYIARLLVALLVCSGFSLYMTQPAQADGVPDAFARWLSMMAESSEASSLQQELVGLTAAGGPLADILEEASQIVGHNNSASDVSFVEEEVSLELYRLLLIEWNQLQTGSAMDGIPAQQTVKPLIQLEVNKAGGFSPAIWPERELRQLTDVYIVTSDLPTVSAVLTEPMSGGTAIGAP
ncbi:MAG TPA: hypothetical protein VK074_02155 [Fodinibius sp.]|nr:hypothetical protein [Fodinibius sp.]